MDIPVTLRGNLTHEPEKRDLQNGSVVTMQVAVNHQRYDRQQSGWVDDGATFARVSMFGALGESVLRALHKGMPVIVVGKLRQRTWEDTQTKQKREAWEVKADAVGPDLSFCVVGNIARPPKGEGGSNYASGDAQQQRGDAREGQARQSHTGGGQSAETGAQGFPNGDEYDAPY